MHQWWELPSFKQVSVFSAAKRPCSATKMPKSKRESKSKQQKIIEKRVLFLFIISPCLFLSFRLPKTHSLYHIEFPLLLLRHLSFLFYFIIFMPQTPLSSPLRRGTYVGNYSKQWVLWYSLLPPISLSGLVHLVLVGHCCAWQIWVLLGFVHF